MSTDLLQRIRSLEATVEKLRNQNRMLSMEQEGGPASNERHRFHHAMDFAAIGMAVIDYDGNFVHVNEAACRCLGYSKSELQSINFKDVTHPDDLEESLRCLGELLQGRTESYSLEKRYLRKDGATIWGLVNIARIPGQDREEEYISAQLQDITARKIAEIRLKEAKQRFEKVAESTSDLIYEWDVKTDRVMWTGDFKKQLGYSNDEIEAGIEGWTNLMHPDDRVQIEEAIDFYRTSTKAIQGEYRMRHKDGTWRIWSDRATPIVDDTGKPVRWIGSCRDITDLHRAEEALRKSEQRHRRLIESMPGIVYSFSRKEGATYWSPNMRSILGYTEEDRRRDPFLWFNAIHEDDRSKIDDRLMGRESLQEFVLEYRIRDASGAWRWLEDRSISIRRTDSDIVVEGIATDITDRKNAQISLARSEGNLRRAQTVARLGSWEFDLTNNTVYASDEARRIYGLGTREWTIDEVKDIPLPQYREGLDQRLKEIINHQAPYDLKFEIQRPNDGARVVVHSIAEYDPERNAVIGTIQDITAQWRAEEALRHSEQKYRELLELAREGVWVIDAKGDTTLVNPSMAGMLGYTADEMIGQNLLDFMSDEARAECLAYFDNRRLGVREQHDFEFLKKDGTPIYATVETAPILDDNGEFQGAIAGIIDITERRRMEDKLRRLVELGTITSEISKNMVHADPAELDDHIRAGLTAIGQYSNSDRAYVFLFRDDNGTADNTHEWCSEGTSPQMEYLQGLNAPEELPWIYRQLQDKQLLYIPDISQLPDEAAAERDHLAAQDIKSLIVAPMVYRQQLIGFLGFDAVRTKAEWSAEDRVLLEQVSVILSRSIKHRDAEMALRESQRSMSTLLANLPGMAYRCLPDRDWSMRYISPACAKYTGYAPEELCDGGGIAFADLIHPEDRQLVWDRITEHIDRDLPFEVEYRFTTRDGQLRWCWERGVAVRDEHNQPVALEGFISDITERKLAEVHLQRSEEKYRGLYNNIRDAILVAGTDRRITSCNEAFSGLFGYSIEEVKGLLTVAIYESEDEYLRMGKAITEHRDTEQFLITVKYRKKDGTVFHGETNVFYMQDEKNEVSGFIGLIRDITEKIEAETALRESEAKLRSYVDNAPDGIFIADRDGRYVDVNEAACRLTGYDRDELLGMGVGDLADPKQSETHRHHFAELLRHGYASSDVPMVRKDGTLFWCSIDATAISDDRFIAFCQDITETKRLREMEARAQRLETAGRVAGQVAHDFNNMLGPLMAYPSLLREEIPEDSSARDFLNAIEEAAQRMTDINQQLLSLGRRAHYNAEPVNLNNVVRAVMRDIKPATGTLVVDLNLSDDLMNVLGGSAQLHRVVANLIQNALDAMQNIGTLTVTTENFYVDEVSVAYGRVPRGEFVKLTVDDTGSGISSEIIQNIFDPFFTSKKADKRRGSGLGLSVVEAVVQDHKGYIDLESRAGEGTSFYVYLPVSRVAAAGAQNTQEVRGGNESVLVIDDDPVQREVTTNLLKHLGYRAQSVAGGEEALGLMRDDPFDLIILDMIMPNGWNGAETYKRICELYPDQAAIIVSGYSETERVREAQQLGAGAFVRKPLSVADLAAAVRHELDRVAVQPMTD